MKKKKKRGSGVLGLENNVYEAQHYERPGCVQGMTKSCMHPKTGYV